NGHDERARQIATRVENVMTWYNDLIKFKPSVSLLILSKTDWSSYTKFPMYGMPHYRGDSILIVAAEDNEFWRSFLSVKDLPEEIRKQAKQVYGLRDSSVSMQAFFDLLAIHELGHAFHNQGKLQVQRKWMGELFCNILLHTYIAEKEPGQLAALTLFPKIVVSGGIKNYKYTSLQELEEKYDEIGQQYPQNYGWYQCRWHAAAAAIYDTDGKTAFQRLWTTLKTEQVKLDDASLAELLQTKVAKSVAGVLLRWERDMVK
ncbi:MAG TPA: hypothetical protein VI461_02935, partial [Chitinophagaceae bacterium]|nr:hypothetical protein [Chitinophagaceae bacterium]